MEWQLVRRFLAARFDPKAHLGLALTARLLVSVVAAWALSGLVDAVLDNETLVHFDLVVASWFHDHATVTGLRIFDVVTRLGMPVVNALIVFVTLYLWRRREWLLLWTWLAANLGGKVIEHVLKETVHRTRPHFGVDSLPGRSYSFPSGHTMDATICYLFLAYIIAVQPRVTRTGRQLAFAAAACIILVVAFSRLYLGVHYPSDIAGGLVAGLAWLSLCGVTRRIISVRRG